MTDKTALERANPATNLSSLIILERIRGVVNLVQDPAL
jgi:hypothetical protein